ncbi:hypothetical protein ABPG72_013339 [Tetrahymena utriculariae]
MITVINDCKNSSLQCGMTITVNLYAFSVMLFSLICMIKMWRSTLNLKFESLSLFTTFIQSMIQFIQNFLVEDIRVLLSSQFVQAITFSFVAMSFTLLYFRTNIQKPQKGQQAKRIILRIFILYKLLIIVIAICVLATLKQGDCQNWFSWSYFVPLSLSGSSMLISVVFGIGLYNKIQKENIIDLEQKNEQQDIQIQRKGYLYHLLKNQVRSIIITYAFTTVAQIALNLIREYSKEQIIVCTDDYQFSSFKNESRIFLFFFSLVEITPCLIVPYVFYYIPFSKAKINKNHEDLIFKFEIEDSLDENSTSSSRQGSLQISLCKETNQNQINQYNDDEYEQSSVVCQKVISNYSQPSENNAQIKTFNTYSNNQTTPYPQTIQNISKQNSDQKKQAEFNEKDDNIIPERYKSNTIDGIAVLNQGFKISDYNNNNNNNMQTPYQN